MYIYLIIFIQKNYLDAIDEQTENKQRSNVGNRRCRRHAVSRAILNLLLFEFTLGHRGNE